MSDHQAENGRVASVVVEILREHLPYQWDWSCTCGAMPSATFRTHRAAHHQHVAERIADRLPSPDRDGGS